jgi:hypothetical protein
MKARRRTYEMPFNTALFKLPFPAPRHKLLRHANEEGYSDITLRNLHDANIVWIIDEAQMSYGDVDLWLGFIKFLLDRPDGPVLCAFSSYGSPSGGPEDYPDGTPLAYLGIEKRISITPSPIAGSPSIALFYTRLEFHDVLRRFCNHPLSTLALDPNAVEYIYSLTKGHPGAVYAVISMLEKVKASMFALDYNISI